jgi:putative ABC transport system ATP-binding protein
VQADPPPVLGLRELVFAWPGQTGVCLDIAELRLDAGQSLFLHGPSGCGKSTLLSLMAGVLIAQGGSISVAGADWRSLGPGRRDRHRADHVGYIFQQFNLLPWLTAIDNVLLACRFSPARLARVRSGSVGSGGDAAKRAAEQSLAAMELPPRSWNLPAGMLSVGQQQRVAAARALIGSPDLVIADEPTSALDEALRNSFVERLLQACADHHSALVFVSHDHRIADQFDRRLGLPDINRAVAASTAGES